METLTIKTRSHAQFVDLTAQLQAVVKKSGAKSGRVVACVPHTTAGITINENADPDVVRDMLEALERAVPWKQGFYRHAEGNSAAHVKASMMGFSVTVMFEGGRLVLGTWQGIYFCEFDGPRTRKLHVQVANG